MRFSSIAITFDTDWAPDWCIKHCIDICRTFSAKATFMITNPSKSIDSIIYDNNFEIGIHPNFFPSTTQRINLSSDFKLSDPIDYLLSIAPNAKTMRTHCLYQSSPMYSLIQNKYKQICYDLSLFTHFQPYYTPIKLKFSNDSNLLAQIPYQFEDDLFIYHRNIIFDDLFLLYLPGETLIANFHPLLVYLNSNNLNQYDNIKHNYEVNTLSEEIAIYYRSDSPEGVQRILERFLSLSDSFLTIGELGDSLSPRLR